MKECKNKATNIVFVFADQMRAQSTGYGGDPNVRTPNLDKLAGESLNFTRAVSNCPVCTPYRACLLTGQYPLSHGLFMNDLCLPDNGHSLGQKLRSAGYDTAWIGKWHLDGHGRAGYIPPNRRQGFEYWKVLECTHDYQNSHYYEGKNDAVKTWHGYDAYAQTEDAEAYISKIKNDKPFALFLSFGPPHDPYKTAPDDLKAKYPPESLSLRDNVPKHRQHIAKRQLSGYYAHITALDSCMGTLDRALDKAGIRENTIFIFTSDHGDMLESHWHLSSDGRGARKQCPYDESILVPFLLRFPQKYGNRARNITTPIATPDIMPTLLSLCSIPAPDTVEGLDFSPEPASLTVPEREGVLIASYHPFADWRTARGGRPYRGIRTDKYTFVRDRNGPWLLFDNLEDPFQLENKVNQNNLENIQTHLDTELDKILVEQSDAFERPETLRKHWNYNVNDREAVPYH